MNSKKDISVIVCCYNSEFIITNTLTHLANQKIKKDLIFEVVLINNNCSDNTVGIANRVWKDLNVGIELNIFNEHTPGLAHARKKGVRSCKSEIIIFCDDDNLLDENYVQIAYDIMSDNPKVGMLGGRIEGLLEANKPYWWEDEAEHFAVGIQSEIDGDVTERGFLWGAGMVIRKEILERLFNAGFESLLLGRTGEKITSGDDSEVAKWVIIMGYKLWCDNSLKLEHFIQEKRLTNEYLGKLKAGHLEAQVILDQYNWYIQNMSFLDNGFLFKLKRVVRGYKKGAKSKQKYAQMLFAKILNVDPILKKIVLTHRKLK